jgi:Tol biopolymer transport system component
VYSRICAPDEQGTLFRVTSDGTSTVQLSPSDVSVVEAYAHLSADWSPDGSSIAFAALVPSADSTALYVVRPDGSGLKQIVATDVGAVSAQWSPDGTSIAFSSRLRSLPQVWTVSPDGTNRRQLTQSLDGSTSVAAEWSPDGRKLLYAGTTGEAVTLRMMNADGTSDVGVADLGNSESLVYSWSVRP